MKKNYSETVINAFLKYDKLSDIAKAIGVTPQTASKYRDDPELQKILSARRLEYVKGATTKMQLFLTEGVDVLQRIIRDKNVAPQIKVNAIQVMFNQLRLKN